jgi:hypothetical protein
MIQNFELSRLRIKQPLVVVKPSLNHLAFTSAHRSGKSGVEGTNAKASSE